MSSFRYLNTPGPDSKDIFEHLNRKTRKRVFENRPSAATKEDVFEQIIDFTLSEQYRISKGFIDPLMEKVRFLLDISEIARG